MSNHLEEFQVELEMKDDEVDYLKPEIIYETEGPDFDSSKGFTQLGPLVEYVYDENEVVQCNDHEYTQINYTDINDSEESLQENTAIEISEGGKEQIQPMMPFFLSSQVFTMDECDDQNEGETIILQIDNDEENDINKKEPIPDEVRASSLQLLLCASKTHSILDTFSCEICLIAFGCLNCLKSHYETMHNGKTFISHYKCKYSTSTTKGLVCPVCELTFDSRNETMDHYITHAVSCDICGSGFDRQRHLTEHRRKVHNKGDFDLIYDCELCGIIYQYPSGLSKHYQKIHKLILCVECKLKFENVDVLQEHEKIHKQTEDVLPYACSKCDKAFAEISDIAVHLRRDHNHKRKVDQFETVYVISQVKNGVKKPPKKRVVRIE